MSLIEKAARLCCPIHRLECCAERLGNNKTVLLNSCSMSYQEKVDVINCVQQELYGEVEMRKLSYNDSKCCIVWKDNFNDEDETCFNNCINTLGTPTIQAEAKIARMEKCKTRFPAIYGCFDECYNHYHDKYNGSVKFNFTQQCSQESFIERLEPGEVYPIVTNFSHE
uniref:Uncharacterized protein n=1 Tax=Acrobeloides nanus TaxID=290746 RepID=A0A914CNM7_9BILA